MRFYRTPAFIPFLFRGLIWRKPTTTKTIYLTFDDGPIPEVTDFVLTELEKYRAKATFFCVGENISRHPDIARSLVAAGHRLGNHTHNHLIGWQNPTQKYIGNTLTCQSAINRVQPEINTYLFRPPHGRITREQYQRLQVDYEVIMWDVLTYDFDKNLPAERCLQQAIKNTKPGSIVVFHDSLKAQRNLRFVLPRYLEHFAQKGYRFDTL